MKTLSSKSPREQDDQLYFQGDLVFVAGEMLISKDLHRGDWRSTMYTYGQLGLVIEVTSTQLLLWFAEFGTKKEEHVFACAPLLKQTTKIWSANSAVAAVGAKDFLAD